MKKLNKTYTFEQAHGIIKFINKDGCFRIGYYNDNPAILIGFEDIEDVPEEFTRVNLVSMMNKKLEIHSKNELSILAINLESEFEEARGKLTPNEFDRLRLKRIAFVSMLEKNNAKYKKIISSDEDTFLLYTSLRSYSFEEPKVCENIKLDPQGPVLSRKYKG